MSAWWSRQLEELIAAPGLQRELRRGRRYAEEGRVASLHIAAGRVSALIQGTRPEPYRTQLDLSVFSDEQWAQILGELFAQPGAWLSVQGGQLPARARQWKLVPQEPIELSLRCSCPVRDLFCKHIAATMYALARQSALQPVVLFQWRGRSAHAIEALWQAQEQRRSGVA